MEEHVYSPELPEYFRMESFRREEFLSQVGSFTQVQYQLFHSLCEFWAPVLDYNQFILKSAKSFLASNNQLELLMDKLKAAHIGLLQYAVIEGELKPHRIILSNKNAPEFYYYLCEDLLARLIYDQNQPFITAKNFENEGISLPEDIIVYQDPSMLSPGYAKHHKEPAIIGISRKMKPPLLIPSGMIEDYMSALVTHIRSEFTNTGLMDFISRVSEKKISEIQKSLTTREPLFWVGLCSKIQENREEIKNRFKGLNPILFTSAQLLQHYYQNSLEETKEEEHQEQEKIKATEDIIKEFRSHEAQWSPIETLDRILKEKEETWPDFREEFRIAALLRGDNKDLPPLVLINSMLIHKDYLFRFFTREVGLIRKDLLIRYHEEMSDLLRRNRTERYSQFFSRSNFRSDILNRVRDRDLQLWELLQKPGRVAEAGIHYLQTVKGISKNSRIKDALELYFKSDLKTFRNPDSLFQLNLMSLFETSYKELGWWSRFILRITGRYDSYITMFSDEQPRTRLPGRSRLSRRERRELRLPRNAQSRMNGNRERNYSARERKRAWAEFDEAIQKQNSSKEPEEG